MAEKPENTGAGHLRDDPLERCDDGETGPEVVPLSHGSGEGLWDTAGMRMSALCLNVLQDINDAVSLYSGDDRTLGRTKKETKQKKTKTFADFFRIKRRNKSKKSAAENAIDGKNEQPKVNSAADGENNDKEKERKKYMEEKAIAGNFSVDDSGNRSSTFTPNEINISQQKKTHSTEDKTSRTKKSSKEKNKDPANADEREERQSEMMTQPLKQNETRKQKKVKQKSSNAKDLAVERSKAEDILGTSLNGKTEDILETKSNGKTEDIIKIPLNDKTEDILEISSTGKTEDIIEIPPTGKTEDVLEISLNDKTDVIMEIPTNGKTEDILEIPSTGKTEDITEIPLNGKIENTLEIPSNGKTEDILEIPLKGKTEDITEIPLNGKNDDILETKSTGKAEDIPEIKSTGKAEDIPETKSTGKAEDIPETKSTGKAEDIPETKSTGKTEDIPETKSTGKAEDIPEIKSTGKTEDIPETKSTGKAEDIPETKSTGKAEDIPETKSTGKTEDIPETKSTGKAEDIPKTKSTGKAEDIPEIKSTGKAEDIPETKSTGKAEDIPETKSTGKAEDVPETKSTGKTEDIPETKSTGKAEDIPETKSTGKAEDIPETKSTGKAEDIPETKSTGKAEDIPEIKSTGKAEDIPETKSTGKAEDIPETKSTGKAEDIPETKSTGKTEDIPETKSTGKAEDIPETKSTGKTEDIPEIKSTGKAEDIPETKSTGKTENIPETKSTGKTEDVLETKLTGKTNNVLRIPFTGKSEHGLERSNRRESSDGKDDRGEGRGDGNRGRGLLTRVEDITGADDRRSTTNSKQTEAASICSQESSNTIPRGRSRNRNEDEKLRRGRSEDPAAAKGQSAKRSGKRRRRALSREWVMVRTTTTEYTTTTTSNRNAKTNDDSERPSPSNGPNKKDKETEELLDPKIHQKDNKALQGHAHRQLPSEVNDSKDSSELLNQEVGKSFTPLLTKIRIERNQDNAPENLSSAPPPLTPLQNSSFADSNHLSMAHSESLQENSDTLQPIVETFASSAKELTGDRRPFQSDSFDFDDHDQAKETPSENLSDTTKAFRHNAGSFSKATEARSIKDSGVTSTEINFHGTALDENSPETKSRLGGNEKRNWLKPQTTSSTDSSDIDRTTTNHQLPDDRKTDRPKHSDETEISRTAKASKRNRTRKTPTLKHSSSSYSSSSSSPLHSTTTTDIIGQSRGGGGNGGLSPSEGSIWPTTAAVDDSPFVDEVKSNDRSADDASDSGPLRLDGGEGGGGQTTNRPKDGSEETKSRSSAAAKDGFVFSPETESEKEDRRSVSSHSKTQMSCSAVEANASAFERCPESNGTGVEEREPMSPGDENQEKQSDGQSKEKISAFVINDISTDILIARQSDADSGILRYRNPAESNVFSQSSCPKTSSDSLPHDISTASLKNETPADSSEDIVSCGVTVQGDERSTETTNRPFDSENAEEKKHSTDCRRGCRETSSSTEFMTGKTSTEDPMSGSVDEGYGSVKKTSKRKNYGKQKTGDRAVKKEDKRRREKVNSGIISSLIATSDKTDSESRSTENESMTPNAFSESVKTQESISKEEDNISVTRFVVEHSESLGSTSEGVKGLTESGYDTSHATVVGCCLWTGDSVARSADEYGCKGKDRPEENSHFTPDPQHVHSSSCLRVEGSPLHQTEQHETVREGGEKYQQRTFEGAEVSASGPTKQRPHDDDYQLRRRRGLPGHMEDEDDEVTTTSEDRANRQDNNSSSSSSSRVHHQTITGRSVLSYFIVSIAGLLSIALLIYIVYIM